MNVFRTEPARVIGLIATVVVLVAQQLLASGIVTSAGSIQWLNLIVSLTPMLAAELTRSQVFSPAVVSDLVSEARDEAQAELTRTSP